MNFDFSDDQKALREELRRMLQRESPPAKARETIDQGLSHQAGLWQHLVDVGATALMLPEAAGGAGLGAMELCVAAEELGRRLAAVPYGPSMYLATQALLLGASPAQQTPWLARVAAGEVATLVGLEDLADGSAAGVGTLPRNATAALGEVASSGGLLWKDGRLHGAAPLVPDGGAAAPTGRYDQPSPARPSSAQDDEAKRIAAELVARYAQDAESNADGVRLEWRIRTASYEDAPF